MAANIAVTDGRCRADFRRLLAAAHRFLPCELFVTAELAATRSRNLLNAGSSASSEAAYVWFFQSILKNLSDDQVDVVNVPFSMFCWSNLVILGRSEQQRRRTVHPNHLHLHLDGMGETKTRPVQSAHHLKVTKSRYCLQRMEGSGVFPSARKASVVDRGAYREDKCPF